MHQGQIHLEESWYQFTDQTILSQWPKYFELRKEIQEGKGIHMNGVLHLLPT